MITEKVLADLFERAVRDLDPAVNAILLRAERRGRRRRARRRIGLAIGSGLVVVALAGTALATGVPLDHPQTARFEPGAATHRKPTSKHAVAHPTPSTHGSSQPASSQTYPNVPGAMPILAPGYQVTAEQKLAILRALMPAGSTLSNLNPYAAQFPDEDVEVDYNDGQGAVDLQLSVNATATFNPLNCPTPLWPNEGPRPAGALPISCTMRTLPNGNIERDAVYNSDAYGWYALSVYVQRPDGITVDIEVGDGILHGLPEVDRARPPGTLAEWAAIAENPVWQLKKGWHVTG